MPWQPCLQRSCEDWDFNNNTNNNNGGDNNNNTNNNNGSDNNNNTYNNNPLFALSEAQLQYMEDVLSSEEGRQLLEDSASLPEVPDALIPSTADKTACYSVMPQWCYCSDDDLDMVTEVIAEQQNCADMCLNHSKCATHNNGEEVLKKVAIEQEHVIATNMVLGVMADHGNYCLRGRRHDKQRASSIKYADMAPDRAGAYGRRCPYDVYSNYGCQSKTGMVSQRTFLNKRGTACAGVGATERKRQSKKQKRQITSKCFEKEVKTVGKFCRRRKWSKCKPRWHDHKYRSDCKAKRTNNVLFSKTYNTPHDLLTQGTESATCTSLPLRFGKSHDAKTAVDIFRDKKPTTNIDYSPKKMVTRGKRVPVDLLLKGKGFDRFGFQDTVSDVFRQMSQRRDKTPMCEIEQEAPNTQVYKSKDSEVSHVEVHNLAKNCRGDGECFSSTVMYYEGENVRATGPRLVTSKGERSRPYARHSSRIQAMKRKTICTCCV
ncbi:PREDICTED: uncharacterized protein LOC106807042 [Priapulus caudatus]|uniref:Uncharacterized protein LOC106807042 n=1 Tax=Priapulus caudatus TaxID=37621 RepID=A0ABM1DXS3_PRICU|nr:PREDICTED: uncharacterized protein LOC106807042 [Priapulus caudatus]